MGMEEIRKQDDVGSSFRFFFIRLHQRISPWATVIFMLPILILVAYIANDPFISIASGRLPRYILNGGLFSGRFDICHAGFVLDQPTIGKWLFWFTVAAVMSLPYAAVVRWLSDRRSGMGYLAFVITAAVICVLLLCILSWPFCWLVEYVYSMGFTPKRFFGLVYGIVAVIGIGSFFIWAIRPKKEIKSDIIV